MSETRSVLEIRDGDIQCNVSVPGTEFVINAVDETIERAGVTDAELTRRFHARFDGQLNDAATLRRIAGWLREGAP